MQTGITFLLPDHLCIRTNCVEGASFTAYLPDLSAHVRFVFPPHIGSKLLEAFEQDHLDAGLQVTGEFGSDNSFVVSEWRTLSLDSLARELRS